MCQWIEYIGRDIIVWPILIPVAKGTQPLCVLWDGGRWFGPWTGVSFEVYIVEVATVWKWLAFAIWEDWLPGLVYSSGMSWRPHSQVLSRPNLLTFFLRTTMLAKGCHQRLQIIVQAWVICLFGVGNHHSWTAFELKAREAHLLLDYQRTLPAESLLKYVSRVCLLVS